MPKWERNHGVYRKSIEINCGWWPWLRSYCVSQVWYLNRSLTSGLFTNVNYAYMSNKLDKTGYLLYLRRTTVLFKNNSAGVCRSCKRTQECVGAVKKLSLSWYLLEQLLHLPLKFHLSIETVANEKPFWIPSQNSEHPRIFWVTGANQNAQKSPSTDLVNTNKGYSEVREPIKTRENCY